MLDDLPEWITYTIPIWCYLLVLATVPVYSLLERRDLKEWRAAAGEMGADFGVFSWTGYRPHLTGVLGEHEYKVQWSVRGKTSTQIDYSVSVNNPSLPDFVIVPTGVMPPLRKGRRQKTGDAVVDKATKLYSNDDRVLAYITTPVLDVARKLFGYSIEATLTNKRLEVADPDAEAGVVAQRVRELVSLAATISVRGGRSSQAF